LPWSATRIVLIVDDWKDTANIEEWHPPDSDELALWSRGDEQSSVNALRFDQIRYKISPEVRLRARFAELVSQWRRETRHKSSLRRLVFNRAYLAIMLLAADDEKHKRLVVGLILEELRDRGGHWLWALHALTGATPAKFGDDFDTARKARIEWGRKNGYLKN
jgi:hypothetical protein